MYWARITTNFIMISSGKEKKIYRTQWPNQQRKETVLMASCNVDNHKQIKYFLKLSHTSMWD